MHVGVTARDTVAKARAGPCMWPDSSGYTTGRAVALFSACNPYLCSQLPTALTRYGRDTTSALTPSSLSYLQWPFHATCERRGEVPLQQPNSRLHWSQFPALLVLGPPKKSKNGFRVFLSPAVLYKVFPQLSIVRSQLSRHNFMARGTACVQRYRHHPNLPARHSWISAGFNKNYTTRGP